VLSRVSFIFKMVFIFLRSIFLAFGFFQTLSALLSLCYLA
jgi:uncharacterized membrane protein